MKKIVLTSSLAFLAVVLAFAQNCVTPPSGIVGWWPGQGNAVDIINGNNGIVSPDVEYVSALVGEGFQLGDSNAFVTIPASSSLNIGTNGTGLTMETWIYPTNVSAFHPIFEWNPNIVGAGVGCYLWLGLHPTDNGLLAGNITSTDGSYHGVSSAQAAVVAGQYQHVALTYDPASGNEVLYLNGAVVAQQNIGTVVPQTSYNLYLGRRPNDVEGYWTYGVYFGGIVDQPSIYSRALSSNEIAAIYQAGSTGKCYSAPIIVAQPASETNLVGTTASFSVTATGTAPLKYQWSWNGANLAGATNATLVLTNVQLSEAGSYAVQITNAIGFANSAAAILTVNPNVVVSSCDPVPSGVAGWWPGQGNAVDIINGNNGTVSPDVEYVSALVGEGFQLGDSNAFVTIPASSSLNIGTNGTGLTMETWIYPTNVSAFHPIFEWNPNIVGAGVGCYLWLGLHPTDNGLLAGNITSTDGSYHGVSSAQAAVVAGQYQHVALTYDPASGNEVLYLNGAVVAQQNIGTVVPQTSYNLYLGRRPNDVEGYWTYGVYFGGIVDQPSIYSRALSSNEIAAIYQAGSAGKCYSAPIIVAQPASETNLVGTTASFSVTATGTAPLKYQWSWNGANLAGATNATLVLTNVQLSEAGSYAVQITNAIGFANSAAAILTVNPNVVVSSCDPVPSGIAGWWPGQGNAVDIINGNNGIVSPDVEYVSALVGEGFQLGDSNAFVTIPASSSLNIGTNGTGLTMETWIYPTNVSAFHPIFEWNPNIVGVNPGCYLWLGLHPTDNGLLAGNIAATDGSGHGISSGQAAVVAGQYQHVALTYDPASGNEVLYLNGAVVAQQNIGTVVPQTSYNLYLGRRPNDVEGYWTYGAYFGGIIDQPSIYSRALSSNEIAAIYQAGSAGKCYSAPIIVAQPASETNLVGTTASFSVTATGTAPLKYQWSWNGANLAGATNATLVLTNVQLSEAGSYAVQITNAIGFANSAAAILTVNPNVVVSSCDPVPSGIAGWWPGQGNAVDIINGNNGIVSPDVEYVSALVGEGFQLGDSNAFVTIPASSSLNIGTNGTGLTMETWIYPTNVSAFHPIFEWNPNIVGVNPGCYLWLGLHPTDNGLLAGNIAATDGSGHGISSGQAAVVAGQYQHVALTYDPASGNEVLYLNGAVVAQQNIGTVVPQTSYNLYLGRRPNDVEGYWTYGAYFGGIIDQPSIYSRALSSNEIAAIYQAGSAGKCLTPTAPIIVAQPASETNLVGTTASFGVTATGTAPLKYQWSWNGANLAGATNATLVLTNVQLSEAGSYAVQITNAIGFANSSAATLLVVAPPVITQQPQSQTVISYNGASFAVTATGTGPLNYQWLKNGTNLIDGGNVFGSATASLSLTSVSLSDVGNYQVVVSNSYASTNSAIAVLTVPETGLTLGSASVMSGNVVSVPVLMNALGVENTLLASVGYDPTKLVLQNVQLGQATADAYLEEVDTMTNLGQVGFAILLDSGSAVPAGTNEQVAWLNFQALPVTSNTTVALFYTNSPTLQQVYEDFSLLPATFAGGTVSMLPSEYEADVYPRTNGDHQVSVQDWLEEGRMVAGLDVPASSDEFLRADCAPRGAPDGVLTVADWVQAGRYALGLDSLTLVTQPATLNAVAKVAAKGSVMPTRILEIASLSAQRGQSVSVPVLLVCKTNENAVGMSVSFDTNQLTLTGVSLGSAMTGARTNINYSQSGKLGLVVAMSPGASMLAGTNQIMVLQFLTSTNASGLAALTLSSSVVALEVADKSANALGASYVNGGVTLPPQPALTTAVAGTGGKLQLTWGVAAGTFQLQTASSPAGPWTNLPLSVTTNGANATVNVTSTNQQQYYRLVGQ